jgi:hypothetical protein
MRALGFAANMVTTCRRTHFGLEGITEDYRRATNTPGG